MENRGKNKMQVLDKGFIELVDSMGSDASIAESARISYLAKSSGEEHDENLIIKLLKHNHTSPFEQVEFRFLVKAPIFVARQWMRHRTWSYSEVSRRYTDKDIEFYAPQFSYPQQKEIYEKIISNASSAYDALLELGVRKEIARCVLPVSTYTTFYAKTDLRNLLHFLELRHSADAQYEIRKYADAICELITPIVPVTMKIWKNKIGEIQNG